MAHSLRDSTVEAFAAKAGLKLDHASFHTFNDRFEIHNGDKVYVAKFLEGTTQVAKFYEAFENGSVKFLTREEASDLVRVISIGLPLSSEVNLYQWGELGHLENNLPNLGFRPDTPTMTYRAPQPVEQNAKKWRWALNEGPL